MAAIDLPNHFNVSGEHNKGKEATAQDNVAGSVELHER